MLFSVFTRMTRYSAESLLVSCGQYFNVQGITLLKQVAHSNVAKHGAGVLIGGVALSLLAPVLLISTNAGPGLSGNSYWTEPYSIAGVVTCTVVLAFRSALSAQGRWLEVFSVGIVAVLGYLGAAFIVFLLDGNLEAAAFATVLFAHSGAWVALLIGWIHGVSTRHMHRRAQIDDESLARTRYGL